MHKISFVIVIVIFKKARHLHTSTLLKSDHTLMYKFSDLYWSLSSVDNIIERHKTIVSAKMSDKRRLVYSILKFVSSGRNLPQKWRLFRHLYHWYFISLRRPPPNLLYPIFMYSRPLLCPSGAHTSLTYFWFVRHLCWMMEMTASSFG